jgi:hypothetical protein
LRRALGLVAVVGFVSLLGAGAASGINPSIPEPVPETSFQRVTVPPATPTVAPVIDTLPAAPTPAPRPSVKVPAPKPIVVPKSTPKPAPDYPSVAYAKSYARNRIGSTQFACLDKLFTRESGWRTHAYNKSSGAYGIPQALPGSKMAVIASDWRDNPLTQVKWGLLYISNRYGTACRAWAHSQETGWY